MLELHGKAALRRLMFFLISTFSFIVLNAQDANVFTIGPVSVERGEKASGKLVVEKGIDEGTFIPVSIIHGAKPGPVLTLNAGLHGTEYVPVVVLQKLLKETEPDKLSGTVVLIHVANIPAFQGMTVYNNPVDNKNINRVFPGKKDGTLSERLAFAITNEIIARSDYFMDLHGGEFNEQIVDYLYFYHGCPDEELGEKSRLLAHATGNHYLIPEKFSTPGDSGQGTYSDLAAMGMGVPSVSLEWGDRGRVDCDVVEIALKGMINVMQTLGMIEGEPFIHEHPVYLIDDHEVACNFDGLFFTEVNKGQLVSKGSRLGYTTDYWGNILEEYYAPVTGVVVMVIDVPVTTKGKQICRVSRVADTFEQ